MKISKHLLSCAVFISLVIFLSSAFVKAQSAVDYKFLEVVDFAGKPVAEATVKTEGHNPREQKTDQKGQVEGGLTVYGGDYNTIGFTVTKTGYYPFTDIFDLIRSSQPLRLELLVIPKTPEEVKAIGDEQIKREFFAAAKNGDAVAVGKFLKTGLDPNLTTFDLRGIPKVTDVPVILFAAKSGDAETIKEFLSAGASVRQKEGSAALNTYLHASPFTRRHPKTEEERKQIIKVYETGAESLIKAGVNTTYSGLNDVPALVIAAGKGYRGIVELLIKSGVPINAKDVSGSTALIYAITAPWSGENADNNDTINYLLKSDADPNVVVSYMPYNINCDTALLAAVRKRNVEAVKLLIQYKADVNLACKNGDTALSSAKRDLASRYWQIENLPKIIGLLEAAGARAD